MYCDTCGAPLNGTETVCPICGAQLTPAQPMQPDSQPVEQQPAQGQHQPMQQQPAQEQPQPMQQQPVPVQPQPMQQQVAQEQPQPMQPLNTMMAQMQPGMQPQPVMEPGLPPHMIQQMPDGSIVRKREAPEPPPKKHTGVLVAVIVALVAALGVGIFFLVRPMLKDKDETTEASGTHSTFTTQAMNTTTEAPTTTEATTETTTEATTTEAPKPQTYVEEYGLTFSDIDQPFDIPAYQWVKDYNQTAELSPEVAEGMNNPYIVTFGEITKSKPDANGNVTVTIPYHVGRSAQVLASSENAEFWSGATWWTFDLCDEYTGKVFAWSDYDAEKDKVTPVNNLVTWNGKTYNISAYIKPGENHSDEHYELYGPAGGGYLFEMDIDYDSEMIVTMPEDYEGLCLINYLDLVDEDYYKAWSAYYDKATETDAAGATPTDVVTDQNANRSILSDIKFGNWSKSVSAAQLVLIRVKDSME